jgi:hypothetical protein
MGNSDPNQTSGGRRRRLNVIYFVDSARTRSFSMPLFGLNFIALALIGLVGWSVLSIGLLMWMADGRAEDLARMKSALATVFEYETRYDDVYEKAYPNGRPDPLVAAAAAAADAAKEAANDAADAAAAHAAHPAMPAAPVAAAASIGDDGDAPIAEDGAPVPPAGKAVASKAVASKTAAPQPAAAQPASSMAAKAPPQTASATPDEAAKAAMITVGNPVVEARSDSLELRFDLTNKSEDRAEGYVWAIAEFKPDKGSVTYIGAPIEIEVQGAGDPTYPERSAVFGIRHFKKKTFSFPVRQGQAGTFTGLKIGVMDRSGAGRMTYNVPIEVRVSGQTSDDAASPETAVQPGPQSG